MDTSFKLRPHMHITVYSVIWLCTRYMPILSPYNAKLLPALWGTRKTKQVTKALAVTSAGMVT
jgi:hypothetical protein